MISEAQKTAKARYRQTKRGKIADARYDQTEKGRATSAHASARYGQTEKGKIRDARIKAKRKNYGFEMINNWFPKSNGHHINQNDVLFIPSELHNSIRHKQDDLESMKEINDAAYEWLCTQEIL